MFASTLKLLLVTVSLFSRSFSSTVGVLISPEGLNAVKTQIIRDFTATFKHVRLPEIVDVKDQDGNHKISKILVKSITLDPKNVDIVLDGTRVTLSVKNLNADIESDYFIPVFFKLFDAKGRASTQMTNLSARFQFDLTYLTKEKYFTATCVAHNDNKIVIQKMEINRIGDASFGLITDAALASNAVVTAYGESVANGIAKTACEKIINPVLKVLRLDVNIVEPVTKANFNVDFHPAGPPAFTKNQIFFSTELKVRDRENLIDDAAYAKKYPDSGVLSQPVLKTGEHIVVVVKESLLPPLFDHYFVSTKTVVAKIVTIYEDVPNSNEKSLSIKAQVEARGKNVFTLDLTPTIKKFGLMPFATMYGDLNLKVVFDVPPTLKIKDGAFLYTSKVRVDGDLTKVTKDGNIPKIMKLENEGFALEASVKVSIERSTQPEKEKQFKAQKMINLEEDPNASLQFEAVVVPQFFTMSYGKWAPSTTFPKVDPKTDSLSYFINKIAAQVIATMPPIRVPLPVKEELAAMGLPGSPLELSLDCTQNSQMRIGMKGDFDFTGIIDQFLYAGANSIDIAGQGGQKKNGFNLI